MYQLKPLFIRAKVDRFPINNVFVDGGVVVNLMPQSLLNKIGKVDIELHTHNMVLSNYEGKTSHILRVIQVNMSVGSTMRPTLFMVIPSKVNYNLILGHEWIHGIGVIPSTLHQRVSIWREDGIVENIDVDHGYFTADAKMANQRNFDKAFAAIPPCYPEHEVFQPSLDTKSVITFQPTHGFIWDKEKLDKHSTNREGSLSTGWDAEHTSGDV